MPRKVGWILKKKYFFSNKRNWQILCKRSSSQTFWKFCIKNLICAEICFCLCPIPTVAKGGQLLLGFPIIWSFLLNWNVFRVYRLRATLWSTLWELIGGQRSRQLSDRDWKKQKAEGSIRAGKTVGPGLIHFVCFTPIAFKCHNLPQIYHVQSVHRCVANINGYQELSSRESVEANIPLLASYKP